MISSNNYTVFEIHSTAERYSWAAYHLFVLLSSLIGDTLILYATFQKDAYKLHTFLVTVIQYIAVSDLAYAMTGVLPGSLALIANTWVLGDTMCYVVVYGRYLSYLSGMCLIAVLTTSKLLLLNNPTLSTHMTKRTAHLVCTLALIPSFTAVISMLALYQDDVEFEYKIYACNYKFRAEIWQNLLLPIFSVFTMFIPNIVIVATTIPTLKYLYTATRSARRAGGSVPWQGTLTVALTAVVYCISTLPFGICISFFMVETDIKGPTFRFHFYRISFFGLMINIMANFYIYALTIKSFRRFLFSKILSNLPALSQISTNMTSLTGENIVLQYIEWQDSRSLASGRERFCHMGNFQLPD